MEHTFVTPVFNGSVSLRDAAGQMIENVTKSIRRKETVDDAYMEKLFTDMNALYRLDQRSAQGGDTGGKVQLGALPTPAVVLLWALGAAWVFIFLYAGIGYIKKAKN